METNRTHSDSEQARFTALISVIEICPLVLADGIL